MTEDTSVIFSLELSDFSSKLENSLLIFKSSISLISSLILFNFCPTNLVALSFIKNRTNPFKLQNKTITLK